MKYEIKNRFTREVQFTAKIDCDETASVGIRVGLAVKWAIRTRANLAGANLAYAHLAGANLARANLARADLARANLADANLAGATLAYAHLAGANLAGANLAGANLACAYLACANLAGADLARANLADANLAGATLAYANLAGANLARAHLADATLAYANLAGANLAGADLAGAYLARANLARADLARADLADALKLDPADIPVIENIDATILREIEAGGKLDMGAWHGPNDHWCGTTHCRAGWAVHCAGKPGKALQDRFGPQIAGTLIYQASRPGVPAPWFFDSDEGALADIRKCAAEPTSKP